MDHRAEQIISAFATKITGLSTTGANVKRGRVYSWPDTISAALSIYQGADTPLDDANRPWQFLDSELAVHIDIHVKSSSQQIDTVINQIRKEVTIALQADPSLGLDFVIDLQESGTSDPELSGDGDKPIARARMDWIVKYRRLRTDPSS